MSFSSFFIATGIGQLPATIVYSYVGGMLTGGAKLFVTGLSHHFCPVRADLYDAQHPYGTYEKEKRIRT